MYSHFHTWLLAATCLFWRTEIGLLTVTISSRPGDVSEQDRHLCVVEEHASFWYVFEGLISIVDVKCISLVRSTEIETSFATSTELPMILSSYFWFVYYRPSKFCRNLEMGTRCLWSSSNMHNLAVA